MQNKTVVDLSSETKIYDDLFVIKVIGDEKSGKSSLINRLKNDNFSETFPLQEGNFVEHTIQVNQHDVKIRIEEASKFQNNNVERAADAVIICCDSTNYDAFGNLMQDIEGVKSCYEVGKNPPIILVGTKSDLVAERKVDEEKFKKLAQQNNCNVSVYASAKNGEYVNELFEKTAQIIADNRKIVLKEKKDIDANIEKSALPSTNVHLAFQAFDLFNANGLNQGITSLNQLLTTKYKNNVIIKNLGKTIIKEAQAIYYQDPTITSTLITAVEATDKFF